MFVHYTIKVYNADKTLLYNQASKTVFVSRKTGILCFLLRALSVLNFGILKFNFLHL